MDKEKMVYLTEQELSEMLNVKLYTIRKWRYRRCSIPYVKIQGSVRYRLADVQAYLERHTVHNEDK